MRLGGIMGGLSEKVVTHLQFAIFLSEKARVRGRDRAWKLSYRYRLLAYNPPGVAT